MSTELIARLADALRLVAVMPDAEQAALLAEADAAVKDEPPSQRLIRALRELIDAFLAYEKAAPAVKDAGEQGEWRCDHEPTPYHDGFQNLGDEWEWCAGCGALRHKAERDWTPPYFIRGALEQRQDAGRDEWPFDTQDVPQEIRQSAWWQDHRPHLMRQQRQIPELQAELASLRSELERLKAKTELADEIRKLPAWQANTEFWLRWKDRYDALNQPAQGGADDR